jgi:23S rRNA U2552 (ribose-2'-O)-methylase RlmE/FtsJ
MFVVRIRLYAHPVYWNTLTTHGPIWTVKLIEFTSYYKQVQTEINTQVSQKKVNLECRITFSVFHNESTNTETHTACSVQIQSISCAIIFSINSSVRIFLVKIYGNNHGKLLVKIIRYYNYVRMNEFPLFSFRFLRIFLYFLV